jgi:hypothetical protein
MLKIRVTVDVINEYGDIVDHRGCPAIQNKITCSRELTECYDSANKAHNDFNLVWAFLHPIDNLISRR